MYAFISGKIEEKTDNSVIINNNGIGYEIFSSSYTIDNLGNLRDNITIPTYLHVKEDVMQLFGFSNKTEKNLFLKLITVSGIGVKTAMTILSGVMYNNLIELILLEDVKSIAMIKGIGKKTAERIVLELKGSISLSPNDKLGSVENDNNCIVIKNLDDAVSALANMGLSRFDALKLVKSVAEKNDTVEQIITKALKYMNK